MVAQLLNVGSRIARRCAAPLLLLQCACSISFTGIHAPTGALALRMEPGSCRFEKVQVEETVKKLQETVKNLSREHFKMLVATLQRECPLWGLVEKQEEEWAIAWDCLKQTISTRDRSRHRHLIADWLRGFFQRVEGQPKTWAEMRAEMDQIKLAANASEQNMKALKALPQGIRNLRTTRVTEDYDALMVRDMQLRGEWVAQLGLVKLRKEKEEGALDYKAFVEGFWGLEKTPQQADGKDSEKKKKKKKKSKRKNKSDVDELESVTHKSAKNKSATSNSITVAQNHNGVENLEIKAVRNDATISNGEDIMMNNQEPSQRPAVAYKSGSAQQLQHKSGSAQQLQPARNFKSPRVETDLKGSLKSSANMQADYSQADNSEAVGPSEPHKSQVDGPSEPQRENRRVPTPENSNGIANEESNENRDTKEEEENGKGGNNSIILTTVAQENSETKKKKSKMDKRSGSVAIAHEMEKMQLGVDVMQEDSEASKKAGEARGMAPEETKQEAGEAWGEGKEGGSFLSSEEGSEGRDPRKKKWQQKSRCRVFQNGEGGDNMFGASSSRPGMGNNVSVIPPENYQALKEQLEKWSPKASAHEHLEMVLGRLLTDAVTAVLETTHSRRVLLEKMCKVVAVSVEKAWTEYGRQPNEKHGGPTAYLREQLVRCENFAPIRIHGYIEKALLMHEYDPEDPRSKGEEKIRPKHFVIVASLGALVYDQLGKHQDSDLAAVQKHVNDALDALPMLQTKDSVITLKTAWFGNGVSPESFAKRVQEQVKKWKATSLVSVTRTAVCGTGVLKTSAPEIMKTYRDSITGFDITGSILDKLSTHPYYEQSVLPYCHAGLTDLFAQIRDFLKTGPFTLRVHIAEVVGTFETHWFSVSLADALETFLLSLKQNENLRKNFRVIVGHSADFDPTNRIMKLLMDNDINFSIDMNVWSNSYLHTGYNLKRTLRNILALPAKQLRRPAHIIGIGTDGSGLWHAYKSLKESVQAQKRQVLHALDAIMVEDEVVVQPHNHNAPQNRLLSPGAQDVIMVEDKVVVQNQKAPQNRFSSLYDVDSE